MTTKRARLGVIADDLTGATDVALALVQAGFETTIVTEDLAILDPHVDAVVVALTTRSVPSAEALERSLRALGFLQALGAERFYFKYCSTFDSTPEGNIGPVLQALMTRLDAGSTVVVPSFPDAGRTVYKGHLFVGDKLLDESPMRDHPLNPMKDSYLPRVLAQQCELDVGLVPWQTVRQGSTALAEALHERGSEGNMAIVVDALDAEDLAAIAQASEHMKLLSGGSGLARALAGPHPGLQEAWESIKAPHIVLSGSASARTRAQVEAGLSAGTGMRLDADALRDDFQGTLSKVAHAALSAQASPFVIYATGPHEEVDARNAALLEQGFAGLAVELVGGGVEALVVAGGETSGAVSEALQVRSLRIKRLVDSGVAWAEATLSRGGMVKLLLKSGNFGSVDLFETVWEDSDADAL